MKSNYSISPNAIIAIAGLTLKEALRKKFILVIIATSGLFLLLNFACDSAVRVNAGGQEQNNVSIASYLVFMIVSFWSMAISGLITAGLISDEIENKTYNMILSKPISRLSYLLGKFVGIFGLVFGNAILFLSAQALLSFIKKGTVETSLWFATGFMMFDYMLLITFVMFITIHINKIAAIFLSLGIVSVTTLIDVPMYDATVGKTLELDTFRRGILDSLYWILPQFGTVYFHASSLIAKSISQTHFLGYYSLIQTSVWFIFIWTVLAYTFENKELE
ncbi:MAG: ABC transporter permease [Leptospira sp.]|nr:ABC transporter permease [Leptospira sp.]